MNTAIIGLGSNIDPEDNIEKARALLRTRYTVQAESAFIRTKPVGYTDQADFINGVVKIETKDAQDTLKADLKTMETEMGRKASQIKFGPRTIDLDIVIFNGKVIDQDFYKRDFIKNSVLEVEPDLEY